MQYIDPRFRAGVAALAVLVFAFGASVCLGQDSSMEQLNLVRGTWVLKSIYKTQNVQGPGVSEQEKLLGTTVSVSGSVLSSCGQSVPVKSIKVLEISPDDFLTDTRTRFNEVGVDASSIEEVVLNDRRSGACFAAFPLPGQDIYIKSRDELLIDFEGVFYRAVRTK